VIFEKAIQQYKKINAAGDRLIGEGLSRGKDILGRGKEKVFGKARVEGSLENPQLPINRDNLRYALASEQQMKETGTIIAGKGSIKDKPFRDGPRIASQYGGATEDWVKKSSSYYNMENGKTMQTHWVENLKTGEKIEFKINFEEKK
jgi:hypothetical protein